MIRDKGQGRSIALFAVILAFITYSFSVAELQNDMSDFAGHVYTTTLRIRC